jgi:uncharacterized membrane protein
MIAMFLLLGITVGMRTMTAIAVLCWFAWLQLLPQTGRASWAGYLVTAIVFTVAAVGEYIGDTLPTTPSRLAPIGLGARIVFGALVGGLAAHGIYEPTAGGLIFGVVGALIGAYGGHWLRVVAAKRVGRDLPVALLGSAIALGVAVFTCWELHIWLTKVIGVVVNSKV